MVVLILVVAAGGMLIELGDSQVTPGAALALSISAVSTAGPQVIDPVALGDLGPVSKLSIAVLMLLGRLSVYIVILSIINAVARVVSTVQNYRWACS
jgi:Trk-type K+ transport system membrane component